MHALSPIRITFVHPFLMIVDLLRETENFKRENRFSGPIFEIARRDIIISTISFGCFRSTDQRRADDTGRCIRYITMVVIYFYKAITFHLSEAP